MFRFVKEHKLAAGIISVVLAIAALVSILGINISRDGRDDGQYVVRIGTPAEASCALDYVFTGNVAADTALLQTALNAIPATGGRLEILTCNITINTSITRAIANVTIGGNGKSTARRNSHARKSKKG